MKNKKLEFKANLITNLRQLNDLYYKLKSFSHIAVDTETTGLDQDKDKIVGMSLAGTVTEGWYIPIRHKAEYTLFNNTKLIQLEPKVVFDFFNNIFSWSIPFLAWNWKFDYKMFFKEGVINTKVLDIMIMAAAEDEREVKQLETRAEKEFGIGTTHYKEVVPKDKTFADIPLRKAAPYAVEDVILVMKFFNHWKKDFEKNKNMLSLFNLEQALIIPIASVEQRGLVVNYDLISHLNKKLEVNINKLEKNIVNYFGNINIKSSLQLINILFGEGYSVIKKRKGNIKDFEWIRTSNKLFKTKCFNLTPISYSDKGAPQTGGSVLAELILTLDPNKDTKLINTLESIIEYKKLVKKYDTFIKPVIEKGTKLVKASYNQFGAVSGRFSSSKPNFQQLPHDADEWDIRICYSGRNNKVLYRIDWAAMEMRLAAALSKDKRFKKVIESEDIHKLNASIFFNKPVSKITKSERTLAKVMGFALMYGATAWKIASMLKTIYDKEGKKYKNFNELIDIAQEYINRFFEEYSTLRKWFNSLELQLVSEHFITTLSGRKRRVADFPTRRELRSAKNTAIQGCLQYDTFIELKNAGKVKIEDVWQKSLFLKDKIKTIDGWEPFKVIFSGRKYTYKLITDNKYSIRLTKSHIIPLITTTNNKKIIQKPAGELFNNKHYLIKTIKGFERFKVLKNISKSKIPVDTYDVQIKGKYPYFYANNIVVHNSGADIAKSAFAIIDKKLPSECNIVAMIHDEFIVETPLNKIKEVDKICKDAMEVTINGIKLIADSSFGFTMSKKEDRKIECASCPIFNTFKDVIYERFIQDFKNS